MAKKDIYYYCETAPEYDPAWHWITDQIALGSYPLDPALNDILEQGVSAIASVRWDEPDYDLDLFEAACVVQVDDKRPFPYEELVRLIRFLHANVEAGRKVYVHCFAGISRSSFVVTCYLMLREDISFEEALLRVRAMRSVVDPHPLLFDEAVLERLRRDRETILGDASMEVA